MSSIKLVYFDPDTHSDLLPAIVELHAHCIDFDDALLRFHPPFSEQKRRKMLTFWEERIIQVTKGLRIPIMALSTTSSGGEEISGLIELGLPEADTGPFRGDVEMLMVSPNCRRQGIAKLLILELEKVAKARGRTLLQLGTTAGSAAAEFLYPRLGYIKYGTVPNYGISPKSGNLVDGEYFYKDLTRVV